MEIQRNVSKRVANYSVRNNCFVDSNNFSRSTDIATNTLVHSSEKRPKPKAAASHRSQGTRGSCRGTWRWGPRGDGLHI